MTAAGVLVCGGWGGVEPGMSNGVCTIQFLAR